MSHVTSTLGHRCTTILCSHTESHTHLPAQAKMSVYRVSQVTIIEKKSLKIKKVVKFPLHSALHPSFSLSLFTQTHTLANTHTHTHTHTHIHAHTHGRGQGLETQDFCCLCLSSAPSQAVEVSPSPESAERCEGVRLCVFVIRV